MRTAIMLKPLRMSWRRFMRVVRIMVFCRWRILQQVLLRMSMIWCIFMTITLWVNMLWRWSMRCLVFREQRSVRSKQFIHIRRDYFSAADFLMKSRNGNRSACRIQRLVQERCLWSRIKHRRLLHHLQQQNIIHCPCWRKKSVTMTIIPRDSLSFATKRNM